MKQPILLFILTLFTAVSFSQTVDCYPNCSVTFDAIEHERIPSITSIEAIGRNCREDVDKQLKNYRQDDANDFTLLRNNYCSAIAGWQQTGICKHGGPPPCCTALPGNIPWINVGPEKAKAVLFAVWHKLKKDREDEIEKDLKNCLKGLQSQALALFNSMYSDAWACLNVIKLNQSYISTNSVTINSWVNQLNTMHTQIQGLVNNNNHIEPQVGQIEIINDNLLKIKTDICNQAKTLQTKKTSNQTLSNPNAVSKENQKPKVESVALTNSNFNNKQTQQQTVYQQQTNNFLNSANNSTNDIQKAMNLNLAIINAAASGNKAQVAQIQQVQNQQQTENIANLAIQVVGFLGSMAEAKAKREEAQRASNRELNERIKRNKEYEDEENRRKKNEEIVEFNRQYNLDKQVLGPYIERKKSSQMLENIKQIFFITYERSYVTQLVKIKTYTINKYSDNSWMMQNEILKKIKATEYLGNEGLLKMIGFFSKKQEALTLVEKVKANFKTKVDVSFFSINESATPTTTDNKFWNQ